MLISPKFKNNTNDTLNCYTPNRANIMVGSSVYPSSNDFNINPNSLAFGISSIFATRYEDNPMYEIVLKSIAEIHGIRLRVGAHCSDLNILVDNVLLIDLVGPCPRILYLLSENPLIGNKVVIQRMYKESKFAIFYIEINGKYL